LTYEVALSPYFAAVIDAPGEVGWLNQVRLGLVDYESRVYVSGYND